MGLMQFEYLMVAEPFPLWVSMRKVQAAEQPKALVAEQLKELAIE